MRFFSRDVVFHEAIFPVHSIVETNFFVDIFSDLVLPVVVNHHDYHTQSQQYEPHEDQDFQCALFLKSDKPFTSPHTLENVRSHDNLSKSFRSFALAIYVEYEPHYYHQAVKYPHWKDEMQE